MVCSTCGYENQVGNRFCGMCGTPLPHRPLTAPGAQSTTSLTHAVGESRARTERWASDPMAVSSSLDVAPPPDARDHDGQSVTSSDLDDLPGESQPSNDQRSKVAPKQFDLVPEIPLDEYVQKFRYVPPSDPGEFTMRGDTTVSETEPVPASNATPGAAVETAPPSAETAPPALPEDVRERLGLEVTTEERTDRPRFLDFNEPPVPSVLADSKPEDSVTPISGPSFLGLSDAPEEQAATAVELVAEEPAQGRWRIWLATAVVVVFGALGFLEWRAQVHQTSNGPVEVIKMKMRSLTRGKPPESTSTEAAPAAATSDSSSKPEMQVEPSPQPQSQNPTANATSAPATTGAASVPTTSAATTIPGNSAPVTPSPNANQPAAGQATAKPLPNQTPNATQSNAGPNSGSKTAADTNRADASKLTGPPASSAAGSTPGKAKPSPQAADDDQDVVVRKIVPGTDEVAKADNASDSAAAAAWLWKATAKGNPAAPVRLADMYVKGDGVPRSCEQAMVLLKTAAEKENSMARNRLASMYSSGTCVQRNRVEAYRWLSSALAANPTSDWAQQHRDQLWQQMTPEERTLAQKYK